jgi:hypothetical protein
MAEVLDAGNIWRKIKPEVQEMLVYIFNSQVHGEQPPVMLMAPREAYELVDYLIMLGVCYIPTPGGRLVLTYMGRLLVQTCADVKGL